MADRGASSPETLPGLRDTVRAAKPKRTAKKAEPPAERDPVARVLVDTPLAHLDRTFDYAVPSSMADTARPGARVKVRFAGKSLDGFVLERAAESEHTGSLTPLQRLVSPEPVLHPSIAELAGVLAERYAGTRSDVLRLAVPPRHAATEKEPSPAEEPTRPDVPELRAAWSAYPAADAFLGHLVTGGTPRAVWSALPGEDWPRLLAAAAALTLSAGRGSVLVVPDRRDVARLDAALTVVLGSGHHVVLTAGAGPARRYREFLAVSRGTRRIVVGTRAAAFAPVADLGLVAIWDDGDDLHAEPRAPYPHAREVLLSRARLQEAAALVGGFARTVEADQLLARGWAHEIVAPREALRDAVTVSIAGATDQQLERDPMTRATRMPRQVHDAVAAGLAHGPVLVQTPRRGYAPALACERCRTPARCAGLYRSARGRRPRRPAGLPLVRHGRRRLVLYGVWSPRAARAGAGGAAYGRGAGTRVPVHAGRGVGWRPRRRVRAPTGPRSSWRLPGPSRWRRPVTRPSSCSTPGSPWPAPISARTRRRSGAGWEPLVWSGGAAR